MLSSLLMLPLPPPIPLSMIARVVTMMVLVITLVTGARNGPNILDIHA